MSETTISVGCLKEEIEEKLDQKFCVQYECSVCSKIFKSAEFCYEHITNCLENTLSNDTEDRAPKRKLNEYISDGETDPSYTEDSGSISTQDNASICKKTKESDTDSEQCGNVMLENTAYGATSQMLSDNEMLITLPYDESNDVTIGPLDFANEVSVEFEQHTQDLNNFANSDEINTDDPSTFIIENYQVEDSSSPQNDNDIKIFRVLTAKPEQKDTISKPADQEVTLSINTDVEAPSNDQNDSDVKILTVLNIVDVNQLGSHEEEGVTVIDLPSGSESRERESFESKKEVRYELEHQERSLSRSEVENTKPATEKSEDAATPNSGNQKPKLFPSKTKSDSLSSDETQLKGGLNITKNVVTSRKEKINKNTIKNNPQNPVKTQNLKKFQIIGKKIRRRRHKKVPQKDPNPYKPQNPGNDNVQHKEDNSRPVMYKKIPKQKITVSEKPNKFSVYEFFDEEEEKLKDKLREDMEKEKLLKSRTCKFCHEVFRDPMDVLRHKREFHKFQRVSLGKKELEPFLRLENRTECPLCFKELSRSGYKSIYVKHLMTHCDEYNFECRVCGLQFRRKDHWLNHEDRHVVRPESVKMN